MEMGWGWGVEVGGIVGVGSVASMVENEALMRLGGMERVVCSAIMLFLRRPSGSESAWHPGGFCPLAMVAWIICPRTGDME